MSESGDAAARDLDRLMAIVREWAARKDGAAGELRLKKTFSEGRRFISLVQLSPESTWNLGKQESP